MVTCPWCGTNYATFQSNCTNCGGTLPLPAEKVSPDADEPLPSPPLAPRPISDSYVWRLLSTDAGAIVGFVFVVLGLISTIVGVGFVVVLGSVFAFAQGVSAAGGITAIIGIPFAVLGLLFLIVGGALGVWRYNQARQVVRVLRQGQATEGQIVELRENYRVRVNLRHPWIIQYQFRLGGRTFMGRVTTLNRPGPGLQPGKRVNVLYLPDAPEHNVLYPHP